MPRSLYLYAIAALLGAWIAHYAPFYSQRASHYILQNIVHPLSHVPIISHLNIFGGRETPSIVFEEPNTRVHMLSYDPFIAYLEDFVTPRESEELIRLAYVDELWSQLCGIYGDTGRQRADSGQAAAVEPNGSTTVHPDRTSQTAFLPQENPLTQRIAARAASLQGFPNPEDIDIQLTSYEKNQEYLPHYDWFDNSPGEYER
ncbi:MAG: hypothetical protein Q9162_007774, partial [Coniocarpon cinnabarinum]